MCAHPHHDYEKNSKQHQRTVQNIAMQVKSKVVQLSKSLRKCEMGAKKNVQKYRCRNKKKRTTAVIGFELSGKSLIVEYY